MTRQDLEKHLKLRRQLMECRDILQNLKRSVGPGTQALTGMPHAPGVKDKVGDLATEITYMERRVAALQAKVDMQVRAHNYDADFKREIYEKAQPILNDLDVIIDILKEKEPQK